MSVASLVARLNTTGSFKGGAGGDAGAVEQQTPKLLTTAGSFKKDGGGLVKQGSFSGLRQNSPPRPKQGWCVEAEVVDGRGFPTTSKSAAYVCLSLLTTASALENEGALVVDHNISKLNTSEHVAKAPPRLNINPQMKTQTIKHQSDPSWNDTFLCTDVRADVPKGQHLKPPSESAEGDAPRQALAGQDLLVLVTIHSADAVGGDKFMGRVIVPLASGTPMDAWLDLRERDGREVTGQGGRTAAVHLRLRYWFVDPGTIRSPKLPESPANKLANAGSFKRTPAGRVLGDSPSKAQSDVPLQPSSRSNIPNSPSKGGASPLLAPSPSGQVSSLAGGVRLGAGGENASIGGGESFKDLLKAAEQGYAGGGDASSSDQPAAQSVVKDVPLVKAKPAPGGGAGGGEQPMFVVNPQPPESYAQSFPPASTLGLGLGAGADTVGSPSSNLPTPPNAFGAPQTDATPPPPTALFSDAERAAGGMSVDVGGAVGVGGEQVHSPVPRTPESTRDTDKVLGEMRRAEAAAAAATKQPQSDAAEEGVQDAWRALLGTPPPLPTQGVSADFVSANHPPERLEQRLGNRSPPAPQKELPPALPIVTVRALPCVPAAVPPPEGYYCCVSLLDKDTAAHIGGKLLVDHGVERAWGWTEDVGWARDAAPHKPERPPHPPHQTAVSPQYATQVRGQAQGQPAVVWEERFTLAHAHSEPSLVQAGRMKVEEGAAWKGGLLLVTLHAWSAESAPDAVVGYGIDLLTSKGIDAGERNIAMKLFLPGGGGPLTDVSGKACVVALTVKIRSTAGLPQAAARPMALSLQQESLRDLGAGEWGEGEFSDAGTLFRSPPAHDRMGTQEGGEGGGHTAVRAVPLSVRGVGGGAARAQDAATQDSHKGGASGGRGEQQEQQQQQQQQQHPAEHDQSLQHQQQELFRGSTPEAAPTHDLPPPPRSPQHKSISSQPGAIQNLQNLSLSHAEASPPPPEQGAARRDQAGPRMRDRETGMAAVGGGQGLHAMGLPDQSLVQELHQSRLELMVTQEELRVERGRRQELGEAILRLEEQKHALRQSMLRDNAETAALTQALQEERRLNVEARDGRDAEVRQAEAARELYERAALSLQKHCKAVVTRAHGLARNFGAGEAELDYEVLGAVREMDSAREECSSLLGTISRAIEALVALANTHDATAVQAMARAGVALAEGKESLIQQSRDAPAHLGRAQYSDLSGSVLRDCLERIEHEHQVLGNLHRQRQRSSALLLQRFAAPPPPPPQGGDSSLLAHRVALHDEVNRSREHSLERSITPPAPRNAPFRDSVSPARRAGGSKSPRARRPSGRGSPRRAPGMLSPRGAALLGVPTHDVEADPRRYGAGPRAAGGTPFGGNDEMFGLAPETAPEAWGLGGRSPSPPRRQAAQPAYAHTPPRGNELSAMSVPPSLSPSTPSLSAPTSPNPPSDVYNTPPYPPQLTPPTPHEHAHDAAARTTPHTLRSRRDFALSSSDDDDTRGGGGVGGSRARSPELGASWGAPAQKGGSWVLGEDGVMRLFAGTEEESVMKSSFVLSPHRDNRTDNSSSDEAARRRRLYDEARSRDADQANSNNMYGEARRDADDAAQRASRVEAARAEEAERTRREWAAQAATAERLRAEEAERVRREWEAQATTAERLRAEEAERVRAREWEAQAATAERLRAEEEERVRRESERANRLRLEAEAADVARSEAARAVRLKEEYARFEASRRAAELAERARVAAEYERVERTDRERERAERLRREEEFERRTAQRAEHDRLERERWERRLQAEEATSSARKAAVSARVMRSPEAPVRDREELGLRASISSRAIGSPDATVRDREELRIRATVSALPIVSADANSREKEELQRLERQERAWEEERRAGGARELELLHEAERFEKARLEERGGGSGGGGLELLREAERYEQARLEEQGRRGGGRELEELREAARFEQGRLEEGGGGRRRELELLREAERYEQGRLREEEGRAAEQLRDAERVELAAARRELDHLRANAGVHAQDPRAHGQTASERERMDAELSIELERGRERERERRQQAQQEFQRELERERERDREREREREQERAADVTREMERERAEREGRTISSPVTATLTYSPTRPQHSTYTPTSPHPLTSPRPHASPHAHVGARSPHAPSGNLTYTPTGFVSEARDLDWSVVELQPRQLGESVPPEDIESTPVESEATRKERLRRERRARELQSRAALRRRERERMYGGAGVSPLTDSDASSRSSSTTPLGGYPRRPTPLNNRSINKSRTPSLSPAGTQKGRAEWSPLVEAVRSAMSSPYTGPSAALRSGLGYLQKKMGRRLLDSDDSDDGDVAGRNPAVIRADVA